jgi:type IV pilus assembly protein PilA
MVVAAIAIPNLLRARMAANESSAVASIRTLNTGQVVYSSTYPSQGYARSLASLGPSPEGPAARSPEHASLIDSVLGDASCTSDAWCTKSGYRFMIVTACKQQRCREYAAVATPVSANTGSRNFCSTSDAVIRFQIGGPLAAPITAAQCRTWQPLQ